MPITELKKVFLAKKVLFAYLGVTLIWSTTPLAIKWSGQSSHFLYGVSWRMVIGMVLLLTLMLLTKRHFACDAFSLRLYFFSGVSIYLSMMTVYYGAQFIDSSLVALLFALSTFVTGIFSSLWLAEKSFRPHQVIALLLAFAGLLIIFYQSLRFSSLAFSGVLWVLVSVFIHSFSTVMFKKYTKDKVVDTLVMTSGGLIVTVLLYFITLLWLEGHLLPDKASARMIWATVYLGIAGSALGYVLFFYILKHLKANQVALLTLITPVTAMYLGNLLNNEQIGIMLMVGSVLILLALVFYQFYPWRRL